MGIISAMLKNIGQNIIQQIMKNGVSATNNV
jgi:hypothetical protein